MMSPFKRGAAAYADVALDTNVETADPHQLIVLLYEGAIGALADARRALDRGDIAAKGTAASKAIQIIEEGLILSLDERVGGELARSLKSLYEYMARRVLLASVRGEPEGFAEVSGLLKDLKGAWESIGPEVKTAGGRLAA